MTNKKLRALAVILPQFHPIPENDKWWGKGFTEWINVVKAKPRFNNHYQPHIPADLGFYDLRLAETRAAQAEMAQAHDIHGFCIHHYWFNGKRLIETPVQRMLESKKPNFPFMLCWANENWTRRWDGLDKEILIEQNYSEDDHRNHAKWLCENVFNDSRYIKIKGKPFFLFFNCHIIPDLKKTIEVWREEVKKQGFEDIYLGGVRTSQGHLQDADALGLDVVIEWQPDWQNLWTSPSFFDRLKHKLGIGQTYQKLQYAEVVDRMSKKPISKNKHFECIMPGWDNSARRKQNAFILDNSTPEKYAEWLENVCERATVYSDEENYVFINAWNEWAEGNHLEPDQKWGKAYLEKTKRVLEKYK
jgi:lipopolysaccharide biosynthesis protein